MSNYNKLTPNQKEVMAEFMGSHPDLAKNNLPNCAQGRVTSNRLWDELSKRLNAVGPPLKDAKMWRKAFADQKYQAKKKLSFNKASKQRTGGGPYMEKIITSAEELIIEASGLEACVEGNKNVPAFGSLAASTSVSGSDDSDKEASSSHSSLPVTSTKTFTPGRGTTPTQCRTPRRTNSGNEVLMLLQKNLKSASDFQRGIDGEFDRLLEMQERLVLVQERSVLVQERMLQIKEEKHRSTQESRQIDLDIKRLELETLQINLRRPRNT